ncbi:oligosaccharide flippase family protein [Cohnella hongkongensis]|uniref:Oligosaccharide flippase family protein n=1 Tax=Cohnella hongkongensis TaxID=178337 RepID=A0ABV9F6S2_9BACL
MAQTSFRNKVIHEGTYYILRRGVGFAISFGGMLLLMNAIGVENYGLFVSITGIITFMGELCKLGINQYLIRSESESEPRQYDMAFTFVLLSSIAAVVVGIAVSFLLEAWLDNDRIQLPFLATLAGMLSGAYLLPAMANLERRLEYRKVAIYELMNQIVYYASALTLVYAGFGIWGLVIGNLLQGAMAVAISSYFSRYRPRLYWSWDMLRMMLKYGIGNTLSRRIWEVRTLINPLFVAKFIGLEAVSAVSVSIRIVEALNFINGAIQTISFSLLARIQHERQRVENALNEAMLLQIISIVPLLMGFGVLANWVIPYFFEGDLDTVLHIYPFVAIEYSMIAIFSMPINMLYVRGANWVVSKFNLAYVGLFTITALVALPVFGIYGYAAGEIVALLAYFMIHAEIRRSYTLQYGLPLICMATCIPVVFLPVLPLKWVLLVLIPSAVIMFSLYRKIDAMSYLRRVLKTKQMGVSSSGKS